MKIKNSILLFALVLLLSACKAQSTDEQLDTQNVLSNTKRTSDTLSVNEVSSQAYLQPSLFPVLLKDDPNFQLYTDDQSSGYYYMIFDNSGKTLEDGYFAWRLLGIETVAPNILVAKTSTGGAGLDAKYYDVDNGRISCVFPCPIGLSGELVAYFDTDGSETKLVVQNMFDSRNYYRVFSDDTFSASVFFTECSAEFDPDCNSVTVKYPTKSGELTTKSFSLAVTDP